MSRTSNDEDLDREAKEYFRTQNAAHKAGAVIIAWGLPGALVVAFGWQWMFTWWGDSFVGLPYLIGLIYLMAQRPRQ